MKRLTLNALRLGSLILLLIAAVSSSAWCGEIRFFEGLGDIPLMEGFEQEPSEAYLFDKPEGRIAGVVAQGRGLGRDAVLDYYRRALPQFGWDLQSTKDGGLTFRREREELHLDVISDQEGALSLRIRVNPS